MGFVDGPILKPKADSDDMMIWMHYNAMVKGWLRSAINKEVRGSVAHVDTTREI
ncbi:hypothetical protein Pint_17325 [Pistacia integerrima]|uniref:Uncharacterized protein n=1 Tax=Pistacia integerrima TaxID=434235 RepID=A0ACC0Z178_9ROSI|nr:hypothetical protein Pint_17325 [Pistacia integerrima]